MPKMKKKFDKKYWILANVFILPIALYIAGILAQVFLGYGNFDITTETQVHKIVFDVGSIVKIAATNFDAYITGFVLSVIALEVLAFYIKLSARQNGVEDEDRNFTYSEQDTYGTSRWMSDKETKDFFHTYDSVAETDEIVIGTDLVTNKVLAFPYKPKEKNINRHKTVIGGSGSGKTASIIRGDVLQLIKKGESMVLTDPSGELFEEMAPYLRKNGYNVKAFNLVNMKHSNSWNCLKEIAGEDTNAQIFADVIVKNTGGDDFWAKCSCMLLKALCLYVQISPAYREEDKTLGEVYKLITSRSAAELDQIFDSMVFNEETAVAKMAYNVYKGASENVRGNVLIDLGSRLQTLQSQTVRDITSHDDIKLAELGAKKSAYFIITSDQHSAFDFLAVLFYAMLFIKLVEFAHRNNNKLPVPVNFLIDEFANIGAIPDFEKKIATVRKYQINITIVIQNIAQIQNRYPNGKWEEIIGCCSTTVFLGCTDNTTAKYVSDNTGTATVKVESENYSKRADSMLKPLDYKQSSGLGKRAIMNPDEVKSMDGDEGIVFIQGKKPKKFKKIWYWTRPEYKELVRESVDDYVPDWKREQEKAESARNKPEQNKTVQEEYEAIKEKQRRENPLRYAEPPLRNGKPNGFK